MTKALIVIAALAGLLGMQGGQPELPPGHPPVEQEAAPAPADPDDVRSVEAVLDAYYASISGPAGQPRDWDRFRSLFMPEARFVTTRAGGDVSVPFMLTPQQFISFNNKYFERGGYFETEVHRQIDTFGTITQVFSTYESRRRRDAEPYTRGINSIQLISSGTRWWIVTVMWDQERPEENPIPARYLGQDAGTD